MLRGCLQIGRLRRCLAVGVVLAKFYLPIFPLLGRSQEAVSHITEEFYFHNVYLCDRYARDFCPCFIRVRIIVQDWEYVSMIYETRKGKPTFISQHQGDRQQSIFAPLPPLYLWVELLESVNEQESQYYDIFRHLRRRENRHHPFSEARGRQGLVSNSRQRGR